MKTEIRQQYWEDFKKNCSEMNAPLTLHSPRAANRIGVNLGPNLNLGFRIEAVVNARIKGINLNNIAIRVSLPKSGWETVEKQGDINRKFRGSRLIIPIETGKYAGGHQIVLYRRANPEKVSDRKRQFKWFVGKFLEFAEIFRLCFRPELPSFKPRSVKRANQLDGKTWLRHSISIWDDLAKTREERGLKHPAMFPIALARRLIECFMTKQARLVLDPFAGVGSTLIAAKELSKDAIGIEISPEFAEIARNRVSQVMSFERDTDIKIHIADSLDLCKYVPDNSVDMVITSPPYWDILLEKRTADNKETRNYGEMKADLGKIRDYKEFLMQLSRVFAQVYDVMKPKGYCCVVVMDLRKKNRFYPLHMDISQSMENIGFVLDDMVIWNRGQEYNNLRPLGYPSVFRVNRIHEFILIFQKPE